MNDSYVSPSIESVGTVEPQAAIVAGLVGIVVIAVGVYDGVVLVNYGAAVNVAGAANVATKVNAVVS